MRRDIFEKLKTDSSKLAGLFRIYTGFFKVLKTYVSVTVRLVPSIA